MSDQITMLVILGILLGMFIWGKLRYDLVAVLGLVVFVLLGLIKPSEAFSGFGHPATITVALVLIMVYAIARSGAMQPVEFLVKKTSKNATLHILTLCLLTGGLSLFVNDIAALAIFMPVAMSTSNRMNRPLSLVLMPISFAALLGGMGTLIGTPPNVIISSYRAKEFGEGFRIFDYMPVGGTVALLGILFIAFIGWHFIKIRKTKIGQQGDIFDIESYVAELSVLAGSSLCGKFIREIERDLEDLDIVLFSFIHDKQQFKRPDSFYIIREGDILLIEGRPASIDKFVTKYGLEIIGPEKVDKRILRSQLADTFEIVVPPFSPIEGRLVKNINFQKRYSVSLLGVGRRGIPYRGRLQSFRIKTGDVLLVHGDPDHITEMIAALSLLPLAERKIGFGRKKSDGLFVLGFFGVAIILSALNILAVQIALTLAVLGIVLTKIIPLREIYNHIDWPIIVLIGALLPIGDAFEKTGATQVITDTLLTLSSGLSPTIILGLVLFITMMLTDILHNSATAIIMAPIGKLIAEQLGVNPDPFLIIIAMGASCAFLTPIGHQNNALIMGVGGYQFGDYWRLGLPMKILILIIGVPLTIHFWPF